MKRLILAFALLATPAMAYTTQTLPDCPTGWRDSRVRCQPTSAVTATQTYTARVGSGANAIWVSTASGNIIAMVDEGMPLTFHCYALPALPDPACQ